MEVRKILGLIFSLVFLGAFAFVLSWGIINFNKVKEGMSGTELYTQEDLNNAYQDGYDTALENKDEYDELISGYRDTITTLNDNISQLNSQITNLKNTNQDCQNQIVNLNYAKANLESEIVRLNENKSDNEKTIDSLNSQITSLNSQITNLNNTIDANETTINSLNNQITSLNTQIAGLNQTITNNNKTISDLRININELNAEIERLSNSNQSNATELSILKSQVDSLNEQIISLDNQNKEYLKTIDLLESEISALTAEKNNLIIENTNYYNTISSLNNQILNLQNVNTQLESTNTLHLNTISSLNSQIANLNQQISDITYQSQNNNSTITSLNAKIKELEESVQYYENYISNLENGNQVVATFEYNGSVYNIQMVNSGSSLAIATPKDTDYIIFNGWTIDGVMIDLSTYTITENVKLVADLTYRYDVVFKVDDTNYNSQIITNNECSTLPENPTKLGYEFDGWSTDGVSVIEDVATKKITSNTTYQAVFTKLHSVKFLYEDTIKSTQTIRNGTNATFVSVENTTYKIFNGWKVNGSIVDVSTYKITSDTTFVADITYRYDVVYKVDDTTYNSQIITAHNYPNLPTNPIKDGYEFEGWSLNGVDIINTSTLQITNNTTYYAVFTKLYNVSFVYEGTTIATQSVKENGKAKAINVDNTAYKVFNGWKVNGELVNIANYAITQNTIFEADITYKYDVKFMVDDTVYNSQIVVKNGYATLPNNPTKDGYEFDGWTLNGNIVNPEQNIVLQHLTFVAKFTKLHTVSFSFEGNIIDTQIIRNNNYANQVSVNSTDYKVFNGWKVNDKIVNVVNYAITQNTIFEADITYKYDVKFMVDDTVYNSQIVVKNGYATLPVSPNKTAYEFLGWSLDGVNTINISYYAINSNTQFIALFKEKTIHFAEKNWKGLDSIYASGIWTDGTNYYYNRYNGSETFSYILDKSTSTWSKKTWNGYTPSSGSNIWTDGTNYYYSSGSPPYVFNKSTSTWTQKTWNGCTDFSAEDIWFNGDKIYISKYKEHYVLNKSTSTWSSITFNNYNHIIEGDQIWTDGDNIYFSAGSNQYILNKSTNEWEKMTWNGYSNIYASGMWTIGDNLFYRYSSTQYYIFERATNTWVSINITVPTSPFYSDYIWSDGVNTYLSFGTNQYIMTY